MLFHLVVVLLFVVVGFREPGLGVAPSPDTGGGGGGGGVGGGLQKSSSVEKARIEWLSPSMLFITPAF